MTPTHQTVLAVSRQSLGMLKQAIGGLPDEALDWVPAPNTNSLTVLVRHSMSSARFFYGVASGRPGSAAEYRRGDRAEAFQAQGGNAQTLVQAIDDFLPGLESILAGGKEEHLSQMIGWPDEAPDMGTRTGMEVLIAGVGHLREHVGQAQLMRDLWLGRNS
ncbi:MAG TPA: DinB family protein [Tepidiformaceae bacterium]|nr:DinB family protein [Tepidiformaceae bacterium]